MQRLLLRLFLITPLILATFAYGQSRDERDVRALIDRALQAGSSLDENLTKQSLADHSSGAGPFFLPFVSSVSSVAELEPLMTQMLKQLSARSVSATGPIVVRVDRNLAWAAFPWRAELTFKDGTKRSLEGRTSATLVKERRNWKFAHWHNSVPAQLPLSPSALKAEADAILQVERDAWEAVKNKQTDALADYFAEDASMFSDSQAYRVSGKAALMRDMQAWIDQTDLRSYQMLEPQVQVIGDTGLLTYYFTISGVSGGKDFSRSGKVTMVFVKQDGKWRALHEHVSATQ